MCGASVAMVRRVRRRRTTSSVSSTSTSRTRRRSRTSGIYRAQRVDPEKILESILDDAVGQLGLDILGLDRSAYAEMLKPIIEGIVSQYSSRPSKDSILGRLRATAQHVYMYASAYLLEKLDKLTNDQLEFVVSYGGPIAAKYASRLYREAKRLGREDLIPQLRRLWEMYGNPTPIPCPRCGFRAVTPDLYCMICGYTLTEKEAKDAIDFNERLRELVEFYSPQEVLETIERGYVIIGDTIKPATANPQPTDIVLHLTAEEKEFLRKLLAERRRRQ
jgi:hypothetical protein